MIIDVVSLSIEASRGNRILRGYPVLVLGTQQDGDLGMRCAALLKIMIFLENRIGSLPDCITDDRRTAQGIGNVVRPVDQHEIDANRSKPFGMLVDDLRIGGIVCAQKRRSPSRLPVMFAAVWPLSWYAGEPNLVFHTDVAGMPRRIARQSIGLRSCC